MELTAEELEQREDLTDEDMLPDPDFTILEVKFTKSACDTYNKIGLDWGDMGDYVSAYELSMIRSRIGEMTKGQVAYLADTEEPDIEEGVMFVDRMVEFIKYTSQEFPDTPKKQLKKLVMDEAQAEVASVGDWRKFLAFSAYISEKPLGFDWSEFDPHDWEKWYDKTGYYDATQIGYQSLLMMMMSFRVRSSFKRRFRPLEDGKSEAV